MKEKEAEKNKNLLFIIIVDALLLFSIVGVIFIYNSYNQKKIKEQNIADIKNINRSSASIGAMFFKNQQIELANIVRYINLHKLNLEQTLNYIDESHDDKMICYELIGKDHKGYVAEKKDGAFIKVDYSDIDYRQFNKSIFDNETDKEFLFTPEFTDNYTACKSFALHTHMTLFDDNNVAQSYTLIAVSKSKDFSVLVEVNGGYRGMSTVFVDTSGNYVLGSSEFKTNNLFQYFYEYNDLSFTEKTNLSEQFIAGTKQDFFYKNSKGQNCIFVYTTVPETNWLCVSCVPFSSFRRNEFYLQFTILIAALLLIMMCFNMLWLNRINLKLKQSVYNEKIANQAKTEFLSRMSHDIRTPLNVIIGMTILARKEKNSLQTERYLENVNQSGKFLLSLVNDILDLNKVESGKMELHVKPYSLKQFASNINAIIAPLCNDKKINFEITGCESQKRYLLDAVRVDQIFFNILSNSVKFTEPGGSIKLECKEESDTDGITKIIFVASDNGIGMSEEFQKHMYESFSQEQNKMVALNQGTGLGLTIVQKIVLLMKGTIKVQSQLNEGTTFVIVIPAKETSSVIQDEAKEQIPLAKLNGKRVLLFEDNSLNAEIAGTLLQDKGMLVEYAKNGKEGLSVFETSPLQHFDAVLMDLRMPIMDGFTAAKAIRKLQREDASLVPIIAMTANAYDIDVENCLSAGMNAHLAKPINPDELFEILSQQIVAAEKKSFQQGNK